MKGYKAFKKGLICDPTGENPFQYAENTVFETDTAELCESGFHFCKNPIDILDYYPLVDINGNITEFAEVESLDEVKTYDNKKFCTKKLKVGAKINLPELVQASINFKAKNKLIKNTKIQIINKNYARISSNNDYEKISSSGDFVQIGSSGDSTQISSSGDSAKISSSGNFTKIGSNSDSVQISSNGKCALIGSNGSIARISSSGDSTQISSSGDFAQVGSSGNFTQIGSSGDSALISSSGNFTKIGSSGDFAKIGSSGHFTRITSEGKYSVICCAGPGSIARGKIGSWITLSEWKHDEEKQVHIPICVKTEFIDGEKIKEDTFYKLENGIFVEVE